MARSGLPDIREPIARCALLTIGLFVFSPHIFAQSDVPAGINSPAYSLTDSNGVNLTSYKPTFSTTDVSIGEGKNALGHTLFTVYEQQNQPSVGFADSFRGKIQGATIGDPSTCSYVGGGALDVVLGSSSDTMCAVAVGTYQPQKQSGSSMVRNGDGTFTYTSKDGARYLFGLIQGTYAGLLTEVTNPDGRITTLTYKVGTVGAATYRRLQSVTRNDGLQLKYTYAANSTPASGYPTNWLRVSSVTAINNTVDYCDPQADSCTYTQAWPSATQSWTTGSPKYMTITDAGGQATRLTIGIPTLNPGLVGPNGFLNFTSDQLLAVRAPTSTSADTITYGFCAVTGEYNCMHEGVKKVTTNGYDWLYPGTSGSGGPSLFIQISANRPTAVGGGRTTTIQSGNAAQGPLLSYADGLSLKTFYFESSLANRLASVAMADGNKLTYAYDSRGNITQETHTPKTGSTLQPAIRTANFDTTCTNSITCNKPNWVKDARGFQTDYKYDPTHGGVVSVTRPADNAGIRPQIRYTYAPRYAWYKNSSGAVVQSASAIWVVTAQKFCRSTAALPDGTGCSVATDEVTTAFDYGPTNGANNLFLRGMAVTADGVTLRTCYALDVYGNRISETLPRAGLTSCP